MIGGVLQHDKRSIYLLYRILKFCCTFIFYLLLQISVVIHHLFFSLLIFFCKKLNFFVRASAIVT